MQHRNYRKRSKNAKDCVRVPNSSSHTFQRISQTSRVVHAFVTLLPSPIAMFVPPFRASCTLCFCPNTNCVCVHTSRTYHWARPCRRIRAQKSNRLTRLYISYREYSYRKRCMSTLDFCKIQTHSYNPLMSESLYPHRKFTCAPTTNPGACMKFPRCRCVILTSTESLVHNSTAFYRTLCASHDCTRSALTNYPQNAGGIYGF